ncbi:glycosyltransferase family 39 protein [bacterium]|nr:glycosyltransferase family 39 protein [bacterium]
MPDSSRTSAWLPLVLLVGLGLRLYDLSGESLWLDEIVTGNRVHESLRNILFGWDSETQGPIYYLWVKFWGLAFGTSEFSLRLWSVIFGTLTIAAIYRLGKQLFSNAAALLAALFLAVHPYAIHYSQEARPYALFLLFSVLSYSLLISLLRQHRWSVAWGFIFSAAGAFYTHVFGAFLILSHVLIYYLFRTSAKYRGAGRYPRPYFWTAVILALICLPEFAQDALAGWEKIGGGGSATWIPVPTFLALIKLPLSYFLNPWAGLAIVPIVGVLALVRGLSEPRVRLGIWFLGIIALCFWVLPWIVSLTVTPLFVLRYTMPGLLVVVFLMAIAAASLQAMPRQILVIFLLGATCWPLWDYYTKVDKDPWRQTAEYIAPRWQEGDVLIAMPQFTHSSAVWYFPADVKASAPHVRSEADLQYALARAERLWVVQSYEIKGEVRRRIADAAGSWGKEVQSSDVLSPQQVNPYATWIAPIHVSLRERVSSDTTLIQ